MLTTKPPVRWECGICKDGKGFYARPCPGCENQKPLDWAHSLVYDLPEGSLRHGTRAEVSRR